MPYNVYDDEDFFKQYREIRDRKNSYNNLLEMPALLDMLPDISGMRILDLGCGGGELTRKLCDIGAAHVTGVDISQKMIGVAIERKRQGNIEYVHSDMLSYDGVPSGFDLVISSLAIQNVENFDGLVASVARWLKPRGLFVFSQEHPIMTAPINGINYTYSKDGKSDHFLLADYAMPGLRHTNWLSDKHISYHRRFSDICNTLIGHCFSICRVCEPLPSQEAIRQNPSLEKESIKPNFLIIKASLASQI